MFNPLKQAGDLMKMRKQAMEIQRKLSEERIEVNENGVRIVISGEQKVIEFENNGASDNTVKEKINKAIKLSQEIAAKKLQEMSGGLSGLLGSMGGM